MKKFLSLAALFLLTVACSKEQRYINKLEGGWNLDKIEVNDGSATISDASATGTAAFGDCKAKNDEFCSINLQGSGSLFGFNFNFSEEGEYRVQGNEIQIREDSDDNTYEIFEIEELKRKELVIRQSDDDGYIKLYYIK